MIPNCAVGIGRLNNRITIDDYERKMSEHGRQLGSFHTSSYFDGLGEVPMTFIRAPFVTEVGTGTKILSRVDGNIVAVRYEHQIGLAFHPELGTDTRLHAAFL